MGDAVFAEILLKSVGPLARQFRPVLLADTGGNSKRPVPFPKLAHYFTEAFQIPGPRSDLRREAQRLLGPHDPGVALKRDARTDARVAPSRLGLAATAPAGPGDGQKNIPELSVRRVRPEEPSP
eukprot:scaffold576_cov260-Pinguiococcus_pyrenoidosus.AAC.78